MNKNKSQNNNNKNQNNISKKPQIIEKKRKTTKKIDFENFILSFEPTFENLEKQLLQNYSSLFSLKDPLNEYDLGTNLKITYPLYKPLSEWKDSRLLSQIFSSKKILKDKFFSSEFFFTTQEFIQLKPDLPNFCLTDNIIKWIDQCFQKNSNINKKYENGWTILDFAIQIGSSKLVSLLLKNGANITLLANSKYPLLNCRDSKIFEIIFEFQKIQNLNIFSKDWIFKLFERTSTSKPKTKFSIPIKFLAKLSDQILIELFSSKESINALCKQFQIRLNPWESNFNHIESFKIAKLTSKFISKLKPEYQNLLIENSPFVGVYFLIKKSIPKNKENFEILCKNASQKFSYLTLDFFDWIIADHDVLKDLLNSKVLDFKLILKNYPGYLRTLCLTVPKFISIFKEANVPLDTIHLEINESKNKEEEQSKNMNKMDNNENNNNENKNNENENNENELFFETPIDIWFEIILLLKETKDILNLMISCKFFYEILSSSSSMKIIWKQRLEKKYLHFFNLLKFKKVEFKIEDSKLHYLNVEKYMNNIHYLRFDFSLNDPYFSYSCYNFGFFQTRTHYPKGRSMSYILTPSIDFKKFEEKLISNHITCFSSNFEMGLVYQNQNYKVIDTHTSEVIKEFSSNWIQYPIFISNDTQILCRSRIYNLKDDSIKILDQDFDKIFLTSDPNLLISTSNHKIRPDLCGIYDIRIGFSYPIIQFDYSPLVRSATLIDNSLAWFSYSQADFFDIRKIKNSKNQHIPFFHLEERSGCFDGEYFYSYSNRFLTSWKNFKPIAAISTNGSFAIDTNFLYPYSSEYFPKFLK